MCVSFHSQPWIASFTDAGTPIGLSRTSTGLWQILKAAICFWTAAICPCPIYLHFATSITYPQSFRSVKFAVIPLHFAWQQYWWNIAIQSAVGCYNAWANLRRSGCSPLGKKLLWNRSIEIGVITQKCSNRRIFGPYGFEILWMSSKNNRAPLLCHFQVLCIIFYSHLQIHTAVTVCKCSIWVKNLKFDRLPWKMIKHLFYATSSFVQHFLAICEIKLELWSENAHIGAKFVLTSVTLTLGLDLLYGHHLCQW